jgi:hypothetical protein
MVRAGNLFSLFCFVGILESSSKHIGWAVTNNLKDNKVFKLLRVSCRNLDQETRRSCSLPNALHSQVLLQETST